MEKNNCYVFWDEDSVFTQCEECYKKNGKGHKWGKSLLYGRNDIKCSLCDTIIYQRKKKKKGENEATI